MANLGIHIPAPRKILDGPTVQQTFPVPPVDNSHIRNAHYVNVLNFRPHEVVKRFEGAIVQDTIPIPQIIQTLQPVPYYPSNKTPYIDVLVAAPVAVEKSPSPISYYPPGIPYKLVGNQFDGPTIQQTNPIPIIFPTAFYPQYIPNNALASQAINVVFIAQQTYEFKVNQTIQPTPYYPTQYVASQAIHIFVPPSVTTPWCSITAFSLGGVSGGGDIDVW